uniref:GNAT family N-acetyltransferase n=1 Tax=Nonomuraea pusilla TaxID=46177 RepID=UPI0009EC0595|nr:GNAT family N-acetyltransferase [Nonomuraea pusilla]
MSRRITPLADPVPGPASHRLAWLAADAAGVPVGSAFLRLFTREGQDHLAELEIAVHPAERRKGVGSELLERAVAEAREQGRRRVVAATAADTPGDAFLAARGFAKVLGLTFARLDLSQAAQAAQADADAVAARARPGYRLRAWEGVVPDELAETFTASRRAMDDMQVEDADFGVVVWDVERVRAAARAVAERGDLLHTVVAVDESDGSIAGFTELVVPGDGEGDGRHYGTGVLPEHRGRGLARWMKTESVRWARERHPRLSGLLTDTADGNAAMRAVNDSLGYRPTHRELRYQLDL